MAKVTLKGNPVSISGELPALGTHAPAFSLTKNDLSEATLDDFKGKKIILNIFPSLDTGTCATSVRTFNKEASNLQNTVVLCISQDLPFAQARFCGAEGLDNVITLSGFRDNHAFARAYGVEILDSPMKGLNARSVVVLDESGKVVYTQLVDEISHEPNYQEALNAL